MAFNRQGVLLLTCNAPLRRDIFSGHAHVNGMKGVMQRTQHHVDHFGVTHAGAPTGRQTGVGAAAHVFSTAANSNISVAQQNTLAGRNNGLQARAAQTVDVKGGRALSTAAVNGRHA